ncbi:MAG: sulfatase [Melioribacteraceae bacterium]|nr:sulfatase [Melioribacteraceae bacterium]
MNKIVVVFLSFILFAGCSNVVEQNEKKLNILWLTCEDISPTLSFYGDSTARTPNLDKLANESLIFENAYTTVGVCAPSRSSLITGMYPVSIGTHNMRTAHDVMGWGEREYKKQSKAFDINGENVPKYSTVVPNPVKCFTEYMREIGYFCTNKQKCDYQFAAPVTAWDQNGNDAHWKNREEGQTFFSVFNHNVTHESRMWMNKDLDLTVDPESVPLPDYFPENPIVRNDVARNYSNIELLDKEIGSKLKELEEAGELDNTIIFFFSDHGGPLPRGKREHYVSGLRVPFMVRFPKGENAGRVTDPISFVDIAPTMLSLIGLKPPEYMQGKAFLGKYKSENPREFVYGSGDRFDEFSDRIRSIKYGKYMFVKNYFTDRPAYKDVSYRKNIDMTNELIRLNEEGKLNDQQSYWFRQNKTEEEFYDCEKDPYQLNNLIDDPKFENEISLLRNQLAKWQNEVGDLGDTPELELYNEMWPNGIQPKTEKPNIDKSDDIIEVSCSTENSSIGYLISDNDFLPDLDSGWKLYHKPLEKIEGKYLYLMANRIGFQDSEIVKIKM